MLIGEEHDAKSFGLSFAQLKFEIFLCINRCSDTKVISVQAAFQNIEGLPYNFLFFPFTQLGF